MLRSLSAKISFVLFAVYCVIIPVTIYAARLMLNDAQAARLLAGVIVGGLLFWVVTASIVVGFLTRRLRALSDAVMAFRDSRFRERFPVAHAGAQGDEIDRLGMAFEEIQWRMIEQLKSIESVDVQRRELLANVSHDLRTPLASMRGYLETLLLKLGSLTLEEQRSYLEVAVRQAERLGKLIKDLFDLTKLEAEDVALSPEDFQLAELANDVVQKFQLAAQERGVALAMEVDGTIPPIRGDIALIERVFDNLLQNALRHTGSGGRVRLRLSAKDHRVVATIADTGSGIAPQELARVFERRYRGTPGDGGDGGAGLGLAITKRILSLHGTDIAVESELGKGTEFTFTLAAVRAGDATN